jgi:hypothetical protein
MAKEPATTPAKKPGRIAQVKQVFLSAKAVDPAIGWWMALAALGVLVVAAVVGLFFNALIYALIIGLPLAFLAATIVLSRRAERAAYKQIEGQPGAVGAVLRSGLRGGWVGNEMPVAVNGKTQDAVYRAVGRGGVVLISEGPVTRTKRMLDEEQRKVSRILPNVPVTLVSVGHDEGSIELHRLPATLRKTKRTLTKPEVLAVSNRLNSLQTSLPIPKGIDPMKARPQRGKAR